MLRMIEVDCHVTRHMALSFVFQKLGSFPRKLLRHGAIAFLSALLHFRLFFYLSSLHYISSRTLLQTSQDEIQPRYYFGGRSGCRDSSR